MGTCMAGWMGGDGWVWLGEWVDGWVEWGVVRLAKCTFFVSYSWIYGWVFDIEGLGWGQRWGELVCDV